MIDRGELGRIAGILAAALILGSLGSGVSVAFAQEAGEPPAAKAEPEIAGPDARPRPDAFHWYGNQEVFSDRDPAPFRTVRPASLDASADRFRRFADVPAMEAALERTVEFDVVDVQLDDFLVQLSEQSGVLFYCDEEGLDDAALNRNVEINAKSHGLPLGVAMRRLLDDLQLDLAPEDDLVRVTSPLLLEWVRETRLYVLTRHPLLSGDANRLASAIAKQASPEDWCKTERIVVSVLPGAIAVTCDRETHERVERFLQQYGRLLDEYVPAAPLAEPAPDRTTRTPTPASPQEEKKPKSGGGFIAGGVIVPFREPCEDPQVPPEPVPFVFASPATPPRDASLYFRPLDEPPKSLAALRKRADFELVLTPLAVWAEELGEAIGIPVRIDHAGLKRAELDTKASVGLNFRAKNVTYERALELALEPAKLVAIPRDEYVLVTWRHDLQATQATRMFALADHPFLKGEELRRFGTTLQRHLVPTSYHEPDEYGVSALPGAISMTGDRDLLIRAERFLRLYARVLAEYDPADATIDVEASTDVAPAAVSPNDGERPSEGGRPYFRPLFPPSQIDLALRRPAEISMRNQRLDDVVESIAAQAGVPCAFSPYGLESAALTRDRETDFESRGLSCAATLSLLLEPLELTYATRERDFIVTSIESERFLTDTRLYALDDHPLLRDADSRSLIQALYRFVPIHDAQSYDWCRIDAVPGALAVTADLNTLAKIEGYLDQYSRALVEYDAGGEGALTSPSVAPSQPVDPFEAVRPRGR